MGNKATSTNGKHAPSDVSMLIAEAAYFKAEQRGFAPGHELEDWLSAEQEFTAQPPTKAKAKRPRRRSASA
jgi:hypothetical protein